MRTFTGIALAAAAVLLFVFIRHKPSPTVHLQAEEKSQTIGHHGDLKKEGPSSQEGPAHQGSLAEHFIELSRIRRPLGYFGFDDPFTSKENPIGDPQIIEFLRRWGQLQPVDAIAVVQTMADIPGPVRERYINLILQGWALSTPDLAWNWAADSLRSQPAKPVYNQFAFDRYDGIANILIETGNFGALATLLRDSRDPFSYRSTPDLVIAWTKADVVGAASWLGTLPTIAAEDGNGPNPFLQDLGLEAFGKSLASGDLTGLKRDIADGKLGDITSNVVFGAMGYIMGKGDFVDAQQWVADLFLAPQSPVEIDEVVLYRYFLDTARRYKSEQRPDPIIDLKLLSILKNQRRREDAAQAFVTRSGIYAPEQAAIAVQMYYPEDKRAAALAKLSK